MNKKVVFYKNKPFRLNDDGSLKLTKKGKKQYRHDIGYTISQVLEEKLGYKVRVSDNIDLCYNPDTVVVNWGRSIGYNNYGNMFNNPQAIRNAVNKIKAYKLLDIAKVKIPAFTEDKEEAFGWNVHEDIPVVCRTVINGKGGEGIVIWDADANNGEDIPEAPLYTQLFPKTHEARYHVFGDSVIQVVQKKKLTKAKIVENEFVFNPHIRNHANGWALVKNDIDDFCFDQRVQDEAIKAVAALGLTFGAVDMLLRVSGTTVIDFVVCEVNSAPGIEGSTIDKYTDAMVELIQRQQL